MKKITTQKLVLIALYSGLSYLFFMWEFTIVDPLKFDFSDVFVLIAGYSMGISSGVLVAIIKNVLHFMFMNSQGIGELTNFVYALLVMIPLVLYKPNKRINQVLYYVLIVLFVSVGINVFNYFISMPIYQIAKELRLNMIISTFIPFNLIKTSIIMITFSLIYPVIDKTMN